MEVNLDDEIRIRQMKSFLLPWPPSALGNALQFEGLKMHV